LSNVLAESNALYTFTKRLNLPENQNIAKIM